MYSNNLNLDSKIEVSTRSCHISNRIVLEVLSLVWIWLKPTLSESCTDMKCHEHPYYVYKILAKKIRDSRQLYKMCIRLDISDIRRNQIEINILRAFKTMYSNTNDSVDPEEFIVVMNRIKQHILWYKNSMNGYKYTIKVRTIQNNLLKQDEDIIKLLKALRVCCYESQSIIV